ESKMRQLDDERERSRQQHREPRGAPSPAHQVAPNAVAISASGTAPLLRMSVRRVSVVSPLASSIWIENTSRWRPITMTRFTSLRRESALGTNASAHQALSLP